MRVEEVLVTPALAAELLKGDNRPVRQVTVKKYAEDMKNGNWSLTHQGIAIDHEGSLIDGQHRLLAVIMSGVSVYMMVAYGASKESFSVLDAGISRTCSDSFALDGLKLKTSKLISTAIPLCFNYENEGNLHHAIRGGKYGNPVLVIRDFKEKNPSIIASAEFAQTMPTRYYLLRSSLTTFLHYQISKKYSNAEEFLTPILTGSGVKDGTVIFEIRNVLINAKASTGQKVRDELLVKKMIVAYNHFNAGRNLKDWRQSLSRVRINDIVFID